MRDSLVSDPQFVKNHSMTSRLWWTMVCLEAGCKDCLSSIFDNIEAQLLTVLKDALALTQYACVW